MIELLPCPWEKPRENHELEINRVYDGNGLLCVEVECQYCGATQRGFESEEEAIAAWNTRAEQTCHLIGTEGHHETDGRGWLCSVCGYEFDEYQKATALFCQSCGSKVVEK